MVVEYVRFARVNTVLLGLLSTYNPPSIQALHASAMLRHSAKNLANYR